MFVASRLWRKGMRVSSSSSGAFVVIIVVNGFFSDSAITVMMLTSSVSMSVPGGASRTVPIASIALQVFMLPPTFPAVIRSPPFSVYISFPNSTPFIIIPFVISLTT